MFKKKTHAWFEVLLETLSYLLSSSVSD